MRTGWWIAGACVVVALAAVGYLWWAFDNMFEVEGNTDPIACEDFEFDRQAWRDAPEGGFGAPATITERERIANAFYECGTLVGLSKAKVKQMLGQGRDSKDGSRTTWYVGWGNDAIGPGDGLDLTVVYDESGTVIAPRARRDHRHD